MYEQDFNLHSLRDCRGTWYVRTNDKSIVGPPFPWARKITLDLIFPAF